MKVLRDAAMPALPGLPPFAPVSVQLLDILARDDAVVAQVAELLQLDARFVGEVLRPANRRTFGFERQIRTLARAVARLGTHRLKALAAELRENAARGTVSGHWRHDVASGFAAVRGDSPAFRSQAAWDSGLPEDGSTVESITALVEAAFRAGALRQLPQSAWSDPARLARVLEEKIAVINN